ncbi:MAG TPA: M28 family peptidase, partial [Candidatus Acidoferrum sp.]|nr:M28 family peptidase [Candidatus Acidoferrum sp.]
GKIFYGTQRSRPAWDAEKGELSELTVVEVTIGDSRFPRKGFGVAEKKIASYETEPIVLVEDSENAEVTADLVEVGGGTRESDYAGKDVKGKIVLVSAQPGAVQDLAVGKFGAAGILSYAQNQKTAWWSENENLVRWGHLETFSANKTFAFMVSLKTARAMKERLAKGEKITLHAVVKAGQHAGNYEVVTATIPGADAKLKEEEIAFSCHLDHQRPGANDNASGCVTILEVARTLQKLTAERKSGGCVPIGEIGKVDRALEGLGVCNWSIRPRDLALPARTIRFIFLPEIEGTLALLNGKSEFAKRIKAVIHMDMVGGGPETKAVFHVTRGPMSLPSFVHDVAWAFAEFVNEESYKFAATGKAEYPMVAPEGGAEPLRAEYSAYTMGSDHDVYQDSSFGIPAIYLNDWPDRYIHTNFDTAANIDPTKLKRAAFIGAASGYFLADMDESSAKGALRYAEAFRLKRGTETELRTKQVTGAEAQNLRWHYLDGEIGIANSIKQIVPNSIAVSEIAFEGAIPLKLSEGYKKPAGSSSGDGSVKYKRQLAPKGPLAVFGYDYFEVEWAKQAHTTKPRLLEYEGLWGGGEEYAYEVLNFADGKRNAQEIRDAVSAEYGPVPLEGVVEYLRALEKIGVVEQVKRK